MLRPAVWCSATCCATIPVRNSLLWLPFRCSATCSVTGSVLSSLLQLPVRCSATWCGHQCVALRPVSGVGSALSKLAIWRSATRCRHQFVEFRSAAATSVVVSGHPSPDTINKAPSTSLYGDVERATRTTSSLPVIIIGDTAGIYIYWLSTYIYHLHQIYRGKDPLETPSFIKYINYDRGKDPLD